MNSLSVLGHNGPNKTKLRKYSSMPNLEVENIEDKLMKMRAVSSLENVSELIPIVKYKAELESYRKKTMQERLDEAAPYNLFFNVMEIAPETYKQPNAIKFTDLLCPSLGKLKGSLHICYYVDIHWIMEQYEIRGLSDTPMVIITSDIDEEETLNCYPNVQFKKILKPDVDSGAHNSKISLFVYEDNSLRVTCGSVNPYYSDWNGLNQALWVSPKCPPLENASSGESQTNFKISLLEYLKQYDFVILESFIKCVERTDFEHIRVFLITSFPSICKFEQPRSYSRLVSAVLSKYVEIPSENHLDWSIILNSIGYLGKRKRIDHNYFSDILHRSLNCQKQALPNCRPLTQHKVMFPSIRDVLENDMLSYRQITIFKENRSQKWLGEKCKNMLRFRLNGYGRSKVPLRASMYYRISPCSNYLAYFLLTSANLTRSSWGNVFARHRGPITKAVSITIKSYEAGIIFIPSLFNEPYFCIQNESQSNERKLFPMLTDPVMIGYSNEDEPWYNRKGNKKNDDG